MHCLESLGISRDAMSFPELGIDLDVFRPIKQSVAREELGIGLAHPLILYVGRGDGAKGLPQLLEAMPEVSRRTGAELLCVGTLAKDPLHARLHQLNVRHWEQVPHEALPILHNACDLLARPSGINLGPVSVGMNVAESLACGTPVVSPTLTELPYYEQYGDRIGVVPTTDLAEDIVQVLEDGKARRTDFCREAAMPYSWKLWLPNLVQVYQQG